MNAVNSWGLTLDAGVAEFLSRHGAEAAFRNACDLVRTCFPQSRGIRVWLLEDTNEDNHTWVVLHIQMPASQPAERLQAQKDRYYNELARQVTLPYHPLSFSAMIGFTGE
jgi:hypothetical protein